MDVITKFYSRFLNILGDLEDLEQVLKKKEQKVFGSGSCSALVKVLPNNKDIYFAQDTWSSYNAMLRILKKYSLKFHTSMAAGKIFIGSVTLIKQGFVINKSTYYT